MERRRKFEQTARSQIKTAGNAISVCSAGACPPFDSRGLRGRRLCAQGVGQGASPRATGLLLGFLKGQRGQSMVEMALVMPVLLLLLLGMADFSIGIYQYNAVSNVAREGARYASARDHEPLSASDLSGPASNPRSNAAAIQAATQRAAGLDLSRLTVTVTPDTDWVARSTPGQLVACEATFGFRPATSFVPWTLTLRSRTVMLIE